VSTERDDRSAKQAYAKYYSEAGSLEYQQRKPKKHAAELRLIDRAFSLIPYMLEPRSHRILDIPCGGGRVMIHLGRRGCMIEGADVSPPMVGMRVLKSHSRRD
jgi:2-polyprenyl-3-methyl-5-hydroxy-6-metoxy-1,4-benzoquinol methylase